MSSLEVLLNKRVACESSVDYTNTESINNMTQSVYTLKELSGQLEIVIKSTLQMAFPNATISYFLFQYNLSNLFPMVASHFNSPVSYKVVILGRSIWF